MMATTATTNNGACATRALSLHIGLNKVDPNAYLGWSGPLNACEADANAMNAIAVSRGFVPKMLLSADATRNNVMAEIKSAASQLNAGDIFLLSYSGHGGQVPDRNGDETDNQDETWCLYDGQLIDDELYNALAQFKPGVRVAVFSDSCHSGTVVKEAYIYTPYNAGAGAGCDKGAAAKYRAMPCEIARQMYYANQPVYDAILSDKNNDNARERVQASVILISGCQDNQYSQDGVFNGLFTGMLLRVWANGAFQGNYHDFHRNIVKKMPPDQTPNFFTVGTASPAFEAQAPFAV